MAPRWMVGEPAGADHKDQVMPAHKAARVTGPPRSQAALRRLADF